MAILPAVDQPAQRFTVSSMAWLGQRGAGSTGRCVGAEPAQKIRPRYADVLRRAVARWLISVCGGRPSPNLVASTTWSRAPRRSPADEFLVAVGPYPRRVENVMPRSRARRIVRMTRRHRCSRRCNRPTCPSSEAEPGHSRLPRYTCFIVNLPQLGFVGGCAPGFDDLRHRFDGVDSRGGLAAYMG